MTNLGSPRERFGRIGDSINTAKSDRPTRHLANGHSHRSLGQRPRSAFPRSHGLAEGHTHPLTLDHPSIPNKLLVILNAVTN